MFWIILFVAFSMLITYWLYDGYDLFVTALFGAMFALFPTALVFGITFFTLPTTVSSYTVDIYSAASKDQLRGNFVFGSGSINSVDKYSTFIKSGNGKKKYTFDASPVTIVEDNKITPHITIQYEKVVDNWWTTLIDMKADRDHEVIEMVVPEGSVTTSFNIE